MYLQNKNTTIGMIVETITVRTGARNISNIMTMTMIMMEIEHHKVLVKANPQSQNSQVVSGGDSKGSGNNFSFQNQENSGNNALAQDSAVMMTMMMEIEHHKVLVKANPQVKTAK